MRHVTKARMKMSQDVAQFIKIENEENIKGVPPVVSFQIQSDPIGEVGVNGLQAADMLEYVKQLFISLDKALPCLENRFSIEAIESAIKWQDIRTRNRQKIGVEGTNQE